MVECLNCDEKDQRIAELENEVWDWSYKCSELQEQVDILTDKLSKALESNAGDE